MDRAERFKHWERVFSQSDTATDLHGFNALADRTRGRGQLDRCCIHTRERFFEQQAAAGQPYQRQLSMERDQQP